MPAGRLRGPRLGKCETDSPEAQAACLLLCWQETGLWGWGPECHLPTRCPRVVRARGLGVAAETCFCLEPPGTFSLVRIRCRISTAYLGGQGTLPPCVVAALGNGLPGELVFTLFTCLVLGGGGG